MNVSIMSKASFLSTLFILAILAYHSLGYTIDCSTTHCQHKFINCLPQEDCFVSCSNPQSCVGSIINCPMHGNCNIKCIGSHSCENTIVDGTLSYGNLNVLCDSNNILTGESTDHCKGMKIYGSIHAYTGNMNVVCNGNLRSCINSEIKCPDHTRACTLSCDGDTSCKKSKITSPINGDLTVNCNGERSCIDAILNGAKASTLSINGCKADQSCFELSLYCPPNTNGHKNCFIEGNDNLGRKASNSPTISPTIPPSMHIPPTTNSPSAWPSPQPTYKPSISPIPYIGDGGIRIYAINGWDDISVDYSGNFGITHYGKMVCGSNYNMSCKLASNDWKCKDNVNENENCNDVNYITPSPSISPKVNTNTKTPWPTLVIFHRKWFDRTDSIKLDGNKGNDSVFYYDVDYPKYDNVSQFDAISNPTIFIFVLICLCIVFCICVGLAQARKDSNSNNEQANDDDDDEESDSTATPIPMPPIIAEISKSNISKSKSYRHLSGHGRNAYSIPLGPMPRLSPISQFSLI